MKIGVYGLGRFGAFWAKCLGRQNVDVYGYSREAKDKIDNVKIVTEDEVLSCDYIFFCITISAFPTVLENVKGKIKEGAVVCDTCSVKTYPQMWMNEKLNGVTIIPTHPMFGPDSGKEGIEGLPIVLCPKDKNDEKYIKLKALFESMGLKISEMSVREHDKIAAYSQGVTHFVGRMLEKMEMKSTPIATQGYKSLMTIVEQTCNDPLQLFYDLQRFNPYAKEMRLSLQVACEKVLNALSEQEDEN